MQRLRLRLRRDEALRATRVTVGKNALAYFLIADKRLKYKKGKSRIVYIGTTQKGIARLAQSVAYRSETILKLHGVHTFHVRIVTCTPRKHVKTWRTLERALLLAFRKQLGDVPRCNAQGKKITERDEFKYFARTAIDNVIDELR